MKMARPDKSKVVSVLLAVFFSFWAWLYTYKFDVNKFWIGASVNLFSLLFLMNLFGADLIPLGFIGTLGIYVWAIVDTSMKEEKLLEKYWSLKVKYI